MQIHGSVFLDDTDDITMKVSESNDRWPYMLNFSSLRIHLTADQANAFWASFMPKPAPKPATPAIIEENAS